jgi:hypothetical protein
VKKENAFQTLMSRKKVEPKKIDPKKEIKSPKKGTKRKIDDEEKIEKKDPVVGSRYVDCPSCGKSVFYREIDSHMEAHLQEDTQPKKEKEVKKDKPNHDEEFSLSLHTTDDGTVQWKWNWTSFVDPKKKQQTILSFTKNDSPPMKRVKTRKLADIHYGEADDKNQLESQEYVAKQKKEKIFPLRTVGSYDIASHFTSPHASTRNVPMASQCDQTKWSDISKVRIDKQDVRAVKLETDYNKPVSHFKPASMTTSQNPNTVIFTSTTASTQYAHNLSKSALKSLLQKNIRLGRAESAVRIAKLLIQVSFSDFVRRLSIIMVEDAILHPGLPWLLWLMMAETKNFIPSLAHLNTCLQIVDQVSRVKFHDEMPGEDDNIGDLYDKCNDSLHPIEASLVKSLITRAIFGGMTGDIKMLRGFAILWYNRFHPVHSTSMKPPPSCQDVVQFPSYLDQSMLQDGKLSPWMNFLLQAYHDPSAQPIYYNAVGQVTRDDIVLSALDQHCSPLTNLIITDTRYHEVILKCKEIMSKEEGITEEKFDGELRSMIWFYRSSLNIRRSVYEDGPPQYDIEAERLRQDEQWKACWELIKDPLDTLSYEFLRNRLNKL